MGTFASWLGGRIVPDPNSRTRTLDLYSDYLEHIGVGPTLLERTQAQALSVKRFVRELRNRVSCRSVKSSVSYLVGVKLKDRDI